jgi:hypothetical protein
LLQVGPVYNTLQYTLHVARFGVPGRRTEEAGGGEARDGTVSKNAATAERGPRQPTESMLRSDGVVVRMLRCEDKAEARTGDNGGTVGVCAQWDAIR